MLETIKKTWIYALVITIVTSSSITYLILEKTILSVHAEKNNHLTEQLEKAQIEAGRLKSILTMVKDQYDIPDMTIENFAFDSYKSDIKNIEFTNLNVVETFDIVKPVISEVKRNQTTQILYKQFSVSVSTADVEQDGKTILNVGYHLPTEDLPESLQISLYPSQSMTITSTENFHIFYIQLQAVDPLQKTALIKLVTLRALRDILVDL